MILSNIGGASGQALLFDLDDTLVDSGRIKRRVFSAALKQCAIADDEVVDLFMNMSGIPLFEVCGKLGLPHGVPSLYRELSAKVRSEIVVFPGVLEIISGFHKKGLPMGIVTGRDRASSLEILKNTRLSDYFQALITPDDISSSKPSPGPLFFACGLLQSEPSRSVFVGDSIADMKSAHAAGLFGVGCTWSGAAENELVGAGASIVVEAVDELQKAVVEVIVSNAQP